MTPVVSVTINGEPRRWEGEIITYRDILALVGQLDRRPRPPVVVIDPIGLVPFKEIWPGEYVRLHAHIIITVGVTPELLREQAGMQ